MIENLSFLNRSGAKIKSLPSLTLGPEHVKKITLNRPEGTFTHYQTLAILERDESSGRMGMYTHKNPRFESVRDLSSFAELIKTEFNSANLCTSSSREMWLVPLTASVKLTAGDIDLAPFKDFASLPPEIGRIFGQANVFFTKQIDSADTVWYALMAVDPTEPEMARSGILFRKTSSGFQAVAVPIEGWDYILRLKGLGSPLPGVSPHHRRTGGGPVSYTGWMKKDEAVLELAAHQAEKKGRAFAAGQTRRVAAVMLSGKFGYLVEFQPTNHRASWTNHPLFPPMSQPNYSTALSASLGRQVAEHLLLRQPIFHSSPHPENMLVWGHGNSAFVDFSESIPFLKAPDPAAMLEATFGANRQLNGYLEAANRPAFASALLLTLKRDGLIAADAAEAWLSKNFSDHDVSTWICKQISNKLKLSSHAFSGPAVSGKDII